MARFPVHRGQGNQPFFHPTKGIVKRGQTVPYDLNGSPTGATADAVDVGFAPAGNIAATNVQSALEEVDAEKAAVLHTHAITDVTNLQASLDAKLTASQAAAQADSTAATLADLVTDFNALLAKLRAAGVMAP